ncbi:MAG: hypothetical protein RMN25_10815 [Anaerolineae bacterium]|nr:hypothetical protein [Thermoflexales bacterium]MDW8408258.1 hypothetical protein [Anaerolineae bacterium]
MTFGIAGFREFTNALREQPAWRAELRRLALTDEILELPAVVNLLSEEVVERAEAEGVGLL